MTTLYRETEAFCQAAWGRSLDLQDGENYLLLSDTGRAEWIHLDEINPSFLLPDESVAAFHISKTGVSWPTNLPLMDKLATFTTIDELIDKHPEYFL